MSNKANSGRGRARPVREGAYGTFLCYGTAVEPALAAAAILARDDGIQAGVVNARFAKPLDVPAVTRLIRTGKPVLVCEDHAMIGGFGSAVLELAASRGLPAGHVRLAGLPDRFVAHAARPEQLTEVGLDAPSLAAALRDLLRQPTRETLGRHR